MTGPGPMKARIMTSRSTPRIRLIRVQKPNGENTGYEADRFQSGLLARHRWGRAEILWRKEPLVRLSRTIRTVLHRF